MDGQSQLEPEDASSQHISVTRNASPEEGEIDPSSPFFAEAADMTDPPREAGDATVAIQYGGGGAMQAPEVACAAPATPMKSALKRTADAMDQSPERAPKPRVSFNAAGNEIFEIESREVDSDLSMEGDDNDYDYADYHGSNVDSEGYDPNQDLDPPSRSPSPSSDAGRQSTDATGFDIDLTIGSAISDSYYDRYDPSLESGSSPPNRDASNGHGSNQASHRSSPDLTMDHHSAHRALRAVTRTPYFVPQSLQTSIHASTARHDPINRLIHRLRDEQYKSWKEIADEVNNELQFQGLPSNEVVNSIYSRYIMSKPRLLPTGNVVLVNRQGDVAAFPGTAGRDADTSSRNGGRTLAMSYAIPNPTFNSPYGSTTKSGRAQPASDVDGGQEGQDFDGDLGLTFSASDDRILTEAYTALSGRFWDMVAEEVAGKTGKAFSARTCESRIRAI